MTLLCFSKKFSIVVSKIYWGLENPEIVNLTFLSSLVFCNYIILGGHILNILKTKSPKLILHLQVSYQLPADLLQEFYIYSTYVIFPYI